ncbi:Fis family transcriptional regulator [Vibrio sp. qd031]|uniref:sigma-54-dependent Fis family transcriptional regulator n=1 Tax=Vibrio sp. qd031 TaxID=1603038 RepID=UPI000A0F5739|nr:sigma-54-dependent Fis family transcriptional regulator [Vibrio sp. qd031]ORT48601.1 Fis family transcriptional regulator [Vibrio sp. qd031]
MLSSKPLLPSWLSTSWERSEQAGLSQRQRPQDFCLSGYDLKERRHQHNDLIDVVTHSALPLFSERFARSDSRLILSDRDGVIISSWGQPKFREKLTGIALSSGACWKESLKGTNAIGTAIIEQKPISVVAKQHYILRHRFISCSACPIFDTHGGLLGVLDITSEQKEHDLHTQLFVQTLVQLIENKLLERLPSAHTRLEFDAEEGEFCSWKGIVITDEDGQVVGYNHAAQSLMGPNIESLPLDVLIDRSVRQQSLFTPNTPNQHRVASSLHSTLHHGDECVELCWQQSLKVLDKDIPILLLGETGVGKNEFVKALHNVSQRRQSPLVSVNCGALPHELIESELFGYVAGAFTGANPKGYIGKFRQAHKGTLFLDEIGDLPISAQTRLLHVLQDKQVSPVGAVESHAIDVQIVAATHVDLQQLVMQGKFRHDLYYRLQGLFVALPSLSQRQDKAALVHNIHRKYAQINQKIAPELQQLLTHYAWPGNLRELDNVLKVACALAGDSPELSLEHIPQHTLLQMQSQTVHSDASVTLNEQENSALGAADVNNVGGLDESVNELLLRTFHDNQGNVSQTARKLKISRNTLYRKLRTLGVKD